MTNREIDALIAEKVMGWVHMKFTRDDGCSFVQFMSRENANSAYIKSHNPVEVASGDECNAPSYSTDPFASKQLRDKMRADGWLWTVNALDGCFRSYFWLRAKDARVSFGESGTEEMAVALAALDASGVDEVENV